MQAFDSRRLVRSTAAPARVAALAVPCQQLALSRRSTAPLKSRCAVTAHDDEACCWLLVGMLADVLRQR